MNISIKYKWIKIKFTHFREIIITITTNQGDDSSIKT